MAPQPDPIATGAPRNAERREGGSGARSRKTGLRDGPAHATWAHGRRTIRRLCGRRDSMPHSYAFAMDGVLALAAASIAGASLHAGGPRCASAVVSYDAGIGAGASYRTPAVALGEPTRFTGAGVEPGAVTPFRPPFLPTEVVSVGRGGHLVLAFDEPILDDPRNPHGIDLIVYGNAFCSDLAYPGGVAGWTYSEGGTIELSADGVSWSAVPGAEADGGLPTLAWIDAGPYATSPGTEPTAFDVPADPSVTPESLLGLGWAEIVTAYAGAAGGTRIDLAAAGLAAARFVRVSVAADAAWIPEIDAVVAVRPAPPSADLDADGGVDGADLGILLGDWGACAGCASDLNGDGAVTGSDLGILLGEWS